MKSSSITQLSIHSLYVLRRDP